jgi:hypothetical protein
MWRSFFFKKEGGTLLSHIYTHHWNMNRVWKVWTFKGEAHLFAHSIIDILDYFKGCTLLLQSDKLPITAFVMPIVIFDIGCERVILKWRRSFSINSLSYLVEEIRREGSHIDVLKESNWASWSHFVNVKQFASV